MAFLQARPTSTMKPICVKMLMSMFAACTPKTEQSRHIGTTRMTASGSDQLSYWAASTRKTSTTASVKAYMAVFPVLQLQEGQFGPLAVHRGGQRRLSRTPCIRSIAWPELQSGPGEPLIVADGIHVVADRSSPGR